MILTKQYQIARKIAKEAHSGQVDKQGVPYIVHVQCVADNCKELTAKTVAFLHDVLEDCEADGFDEQYLRSQGIDNKIISIVKLLTRKEGQSYSEYLTVIGTDKTAIEVKLCDLKHNMDLTRIKSELTDEDIRRTRKYHKSYLKLEKLLKETTDGLDID